MASVASLIHVMAALPGIADKLDKLECMVLQLQGRVDDVFREVYKTTEDKDSEEEDGTEDLMDTDGEQSGEDGSYESSFIDDAEQEGEAGDSEEDYDPMQKSRRKTMTRRTGVERRRGPRRRARRVVSMRSTDYHNILIWRAELPT